MKVLLTLLATAAWFGFSHYWYTCHLVGACYACAQPVLAEAGNTAESSAAGSLAEAAIKFTPASAELIRGSTFPALREQLTAARRPDWVLVATGYYDLSDPTPVGFANLGEARAAAAVESLFPNLTKEQHKLVGSLRTAAETALPGVEGATLQWASPETAATLQSADVAAVVKTALDKATIRFPFDDADRALDPALDVYLDELATRLEASTESVQLTGHTDDTGTDDYNVALGDRRAAFIQERLVSRGIGSDRITRESRGEAEPVSSNDSEAGKSLNRRVDITITPSSTKQ